MSELWYIYWREILSPVVLFCMQMCIFKSLSIRIYVCLQFYVCMYDRPICYRLEILSSATMSSASLHLTHVIFFIANVPETKHLGILTWREHLPSVIDGGMHQQEITEFTYIVTSKCQRIITPISVTAWLARRCAYSWRLDISYCVRRMRISLGEILMARNYYSKWRRLVKTCCMRLETSWICRRCGWEEERKKKVKKRKRKKRYGEQDWAGGREKYVLTTKRIILAIIAAVVV